MGSVAGQPPWLRRQIRHSSCAAACADAAIRRRENFEYVVYDAADRTAMGPEQVLTEFDELDGEDVTGWSASQIVAFLTGGGSLLVWVPRPASAVSDGIGFHVVLLAGTQTGILLADPGRVASDIEWEPACRSTSADQAAEIASGCRLIATPGPPLSGPA